MRESQHDFWLRTLTEMGGGGLFYEPPSLPEPGGKFPLMLTRKTVDSVSGKSIVKEMIILDEEELESGRKLGFSNSNLGITSDAS